MTNSLQDYLASADGAGKVLAHARLLTRLAKLFEEIAPRHLVQASRLANYKSGTIVIHASSGAVATKLRQLAPTLVDELSQRGVECSGLQVKVQAASRAHAWAAPAPARKVLSARTSQGLSALCRSLPDSPLRAALDRLLAHSAREE